MHLSSKQKNPVKGEIPQQTNGINPYSSHERELNAHYASDLEIRNMVDWLEWEENKRLTTEQVDNLKEMLNSKDSESITLAKELIKAICNGTDI